MRWICVWCRRRDGNAEHYDGCPAPERDQLRARVAELGADIERRQNEEAMVLPEDFGLVEYVTWLRKQIERAEALVTDLEAEVAEVWTALICERERADMFQKQRDYHEARAAQLEAVVEVAKAYVIAHSHGGDYTQLGPLFRQLTQDIDALEDKIYDDPKKFDTLY